MTLKIYAKPEFQFFSSALEKQIMISSFASKPRLGDQLVKAARLNRDQLRISSPFRNIVDQDFFPAGCYNFSYPSLP